MENKCVMLIDQNLPTGLIANSACVLGLTLGNKMEGIIGHELTDEKGRRHEGITKTPIPILKGKSELLKEIRDKCYLEEFNDVFTVDFCNAAQQTKNYEDYSEKLKSTPYDEIEYLGIVMYGPKKKINRLTGNLSLLR